MPEQNLDELMDRAQEHVEAGRLDDAKALYERVCDGEPENEESWFMLGVIHSELGDYEDAESCLGKVIDIRGDHIEAYHNLANVLRLKGDLSGAKSLLNKALERNPNSGDTWSLLGAINGMMGNDEEAQSCLQRAASSQTDSVETHANLAHALLGQGKLKEAQEACQHAVSIDQDSGPAWELLAQINQKLGMMDASIVAAERARDLLPAETGPHLLLGRAFQSMGDFAGAVEHYRKILELEPESAIAHGALGVSLDKLGDSDEGEKSLRKSLALDNKNDWVLVSLGNLLNEKRSFGEAENCFLSALSMSPERADAHYGLGETLYEQGRYDDAEKSLRKAIELDAELWNAYIILGHVLNQQGKFNEAVESFLVPPRSRRSPGVTEPGNTEDFHSVTRPKLEHDIEQIRYLEEINKLPGKYAGIVADYEGVLSRLSVKPGNTSVIALDSEDATSIAPTYNRLFTFKSAPLMDGGALNPKLDRAALEAAYHGHGPGILQVDDLLKPEALDEIRQFCLQSSFWYAYRYHGGYVGATIEDGFVCPLLLQLAEELRTSFPGIFKHHRLTKMWAFRYDTHLSGINVHADFAAVNVNFWVTPDEANMDPDSGGLIMWDKEAPLDWDFDTYNKNQGAIRKAIEEMGAEPVKITHKQNRGAIFNSNLFHETDQMNFRDGFENRRVNITLLYGDRQAPRA